MKTNVLLLMASLMLVFSSCTVRIGEGGDLVEPSEKIVKVKYQQDAFDKFENRVVGNILLVQTTDSTSGVKVSAPENYIELLNFKNENGKLILDFANGNYNLEMDSIKITVYSPNFKEIVNKGAADIRLNGLNSENLELTNSGVGAFNFSNLVVRKVNVLCSGVGSIKMNGRAGKVDYRCTGVGNIEAKDLKARRVDANVNGVGGIECFASEYLHGRVTGVGSLRYAGHPKKTDLHHSMTGSISEL